MMRNIYHHSAAAAAAARGYPYPTAPNSMNSMSRYPLAMNSGYSSVAQFSGIGSMHGGMTGMTGTGNMPPSMTGMSGMTGIAHAQQSQRIQMGPADYGLNLVRIIGIMNMIMALIMLGMFTISMIINKIILVMLP